jgi:hypothetical protein
MWCLNQQKDEFPFISICDIILTPDLRTAQAFPHSTECDVIVTVYISVGTYRIAMFIQGKIRGLL